MNEPYDSNTRIENLRQYVNENLIISSKAYDSAKNSIEELKTEFESSTDPLVRG